MNSDKAIQGAVNDLIQIRRAIDKTNGRNSTIPTQSIAISAGLIFQGLCCLIASALLAFELMSDQSMTRILLMSADDKELGGLGLAQVAITIVALLMCVYFIVWRAARHSEQDLNNYLVRNFQYLRNLSFASDLFMKFTPISALVLSGHPEWISPLLSLYIGDYLIQGRFFTLPTRVSLSLAVASFATAIAQYHFHSTSLVWPLVHFLMIATASLAYLYSEKPKNSQTAQAE